MALVLSSSVACSGEGYQSLDGPGGAATIGGSAGGGASSANGSTGGAAGSTGGAAGGTGGAAGGTGGAAGGASECVMSGAFRGPTMWAGRDCTQCHGFNIAGTLFPTLHVRDFCDGFNNAAAEAIVELTGANGARLTLTPNSVGNFYSDAPGQGLVLPYTALVRTASGTRAMQSKQSQGNCNACHTEAGDNGAPGRIILP